MTIDSLNRKGDVNKAIERWENMGEAGPKTFTALQTDPGYLNPADIQNFGTLLQQTNHPITVAPETASPMSQVILILAVALILILLLVGGFYIFRLLRKGTGPVTAVMQANEASRKAEKTNFEEMGLAPPITQTMTTYVLGDDLYDESFSIDTSGGEFLGEYGVGVSDTVGVGEPKKVSALEIWLFDKNDIRTVTKVIMSDHGFKDEALKSRLAAKGEPVLAAAGAPARD